MPLETTTPQILEPWHWQAAFTNTRGNIFGYTGEIRIAADLHMLPEQVTEHLCGMFKVSDRYSGLTLKGLSVQKIDPWGIL